MSETETMTAQGERQYTADDLRAHIKPLSKNPIARFFQSIYRKWLGVWYNFAGKHPKLSNILYMVFFFIVFSEGVTIFQFIVMTFLPYAFESMWTQPFVWPAIALPWTDAAGNALNYAIFNEPVKFLNAAGDAVLASTAAQVKEFTALGYKLQVAGLGNFIAFEIAVFLAQCINFPLQRNITYRSHGNPWYQAMWYFIGWVLVSIFTNAVWGIMNPLMMSWNWNDVVIGLIKTVLTGGVSMLIFFFIFLVIFPNDNKVANKAKAKYEKLKSQNAPVDKVEQAHAKYTMAQNRADRANAEKEFYKAKSQASGKAMRYFAIVEKSEKAESADGKALLIESAEKAFAEAVEAVKLSEEKEALYKEVCAVA